MSVITVVEHHWRCNGCKKVEIDRTQVARGGVLPTPNWGLAGWLHLDLDGRDYCPECVKKIQWPGGCER
jgi:hypothetical protein